MRALQELLAALMQGFGFMNRFVSRVNAEPGPKLSRSSFPYVKLGSVGILDHTFVKGSR